MGPCNYCGKWHCECEQNIQALFALRVHRDRAIQEHRQRKARHDQSFQRFMAKVLHG